ncbi:MAG TPA: monofunctional biosynthetic peptidoglycan transglycosylase [Bacteroidota bacterium]|nr:monofunctional biosynthetic peptidoglycan transglycosylase [Bacteroidota bacterium]
MRAFRWIRAHRVKSVLLVLLFLVAAELATIPWFDIARLGRDNPVTTALMRQRMAEARAAGKPYRITQRWIPLERIPRHVIDAVIVAEDGTFFTHGGVDWFEVRESIAKDIHERRAARGASTITQQVAKNLFLSTSKDPVRKLKELIITELLEHELSKERILEIYMNIVEWGPGIFGIDAAAETYFGKTASALTLDEGARLAAVIPSPLRHRPDGDGRYVSRRTGIVLDRMEARSMVPRADSAAAAPSPAAVDSAAFDLTPLPETDTADTDEGGAHGL